MLSNSLLCGENFGENNADHIHISVSSEVPENWMQQIAALNYYGYSPYVIITGGYNDYNVNGIYDIDERLYSGGEATRIYATADGWNSG